MKTQSGLLILTILASILLAACSPDSPTTNASTSAPANTPTASPAETLTQAPGAEIASDEELKNGTYLIDGQSIRLINGIAETEVAPGSASKLVTRYFGNPVSVDLNADGLLDSAFIVQQAGGGSGTFYYAVAALKTENGYMGTNAVFLGDRIAPQSTTIDPNNPSQFIVNYADRNAGEPMSVQPSAGISKTFKLQNGSLLEVAAAPK